MSDDPARRALAEQQRRLLDGLSNGPAPVGFDPSRLELTARMLRNKRARTVARSWPELSRIAGFAAKFDAYARQNPIVTDDGAGADGERFVRSLRSVEPVPTGVTTEWLRHRARRTWVAVAVRNGPAIAIRLPGTARRVWVFAPTFRLRVR